MMMTMMMILMNSKVAWEREREQEQEGGDLLLVAQELQIIMIPKQMN